MKKPGYTIHRITINGDLIISTGFGRVVYVKHPELGDDQWHKVVKRVTIKQLGMVLEYVGGLNSDELLLELL